MKGHSEGYVLLYPLLFLTLFGLLAAGVLPRYTAWYREARLTYEAERLAGELRLLRQASRLSLMRYAPETPSTTGRSFATTRAIGATG